MPAQIAKGHYKGAVEIWRKGHQEIFRNRIASTVQVECEQVNRPTTTLPTTVIHPKLGLERFIRYFTTLLDECLKQVEINIDHLTSDGHAMDGVNDA